MVFYRERFHGRVQSVRLTREFVWFFIDLSRISRELFVGSESFFGWLKSMYRGIEKNVIGEREYR